MTQSKRSALLTALISCTLLITALGAVACTQQQSQPPSAPPVASTPSPQPHGHEGRWAAGGYRADACMSCHAQSDKAAKLPVDHFVNQNPSDGLVGERTQCATCHVEQHDESGK